MSAERQLSHYLLRYARCCMAGRAHGPLFLCLDSSPYYSLVCFPRCLLRLGGLGTGVAELLTRLAVGEYVPRGHGHFGHLARSSILSTKSRSMQQPCSSPHLFSRCCDGYRLRHHKLAAASTAPVALNILEFVISMVTGYFHSMNLAHPAQEDHPHQYLVYSLSMTGERNVGHTPVSGLSAKVFAEVGYQDHCEDQLELLQRFVPFSLCFVGVVFF